MLQLIPLFHDLWEPWSKAPENWLGTDTYTASYFGSSSFPPRSRPKDPETYPYVSVQRLAVPTTKTSSYVIGFNVDGTAMHQSKSLDWNAQNTSICICRDKSSQS